jgi:hypothetical protein
MNWESGREEKVLPNGDGIILILKSFHVLAFRRRVTRESKQRREK